MDSEPFETEETAALKLTLETLEKKRRKVVQNLNSLNSRLRALSAGHSDEGRLVEKIQRTNEQASKLSLEIEEIRKRLAQLDNQKPSIESQLTATRRTLQPDSVYDEINDHQNALNRFVGAANAAVIALTGAFVNSHVDALTPEHDHLIFAMLGIAIAGLLISPMHPLVGMVRATALLQVSRARAGMLASPLAVADLSRREQLARKARGIMLGIQYSCWVLSLILGGFLLIKFLTSADLT